MILEPIPNILEPDINLATYNEIDEPFVDIFEYTNGNILVEPMYYANNYNGAINRVFVRKTVADKLVYANGVETQIGEQISNAGVSTSREYTHEYDEVLMENSPINGICNFNDYFYESVRNKFD